MKPALVQIWQDELGRAGISVHVDQESCNQYRGQPDDPDVRTTYGRPYLADVSDEHFAVLEAHGGSMTYWRQEDYPGDWPCPPRPVDDAGQRAAAYQGYRAEQLRRVCGRRLLRVEPHPGRPDDPGSLVLVFDGGRVTLEVAGDPMMPELVINGHPYPPVTSDSNPQPALTTASTP